MPDVGDGVDFLFHTVTSQSIGRALLGARTLGSKALQIALWNGLLSSMTGTTADIRLLPVHVPTAQKGEEIRVSEDTSGRVEQSDPPGGGENRKENAEESRSDLRPSGPRVTRMVPRRRSMHIRNRLKQWQWVVGLVMVATLCGLSHAQERLYCTTRANVGMGGITGLRFSRNPELVPGERCLPNFSATTGTCRCQDVLDEITLVTHGFSIRNNTNVARTQTLCMTLGTTACACVNYTVNPGDTTVRMVCKVNEPQVFGDEKRLLTTRYELAPTQFFNSVIRLSLQEPR